MAQLLVRGLDSEVKVRLQARAAKHGQSMEAEARDILRDALKDEGAAGKRARDAHRAALRPHRAEARRDARAP